MVRRYSICVFIICLFCICGCTDGTQAKTISIEQSNTYWEVKDIKLNDFPKDVNVIGATEDGVYYEQYFCEDINSGKENLSYHFLSCSGEDNLLYQEENQHSYRSFYINDTDLILSISMENGLKVLNLSPDGNVEELFRQNAVQLPFIQTSRSQILTIRNNYTENGEYENALILSDTITGEDTCVYLAAFQSEQGNGEDIVCTALSDTEVFFVVDVMQERKSKYWLYIYNIAQNKIAEKVALEQGAVFAVCAKDTVLLSETDEYDYLTEAGSIGKIVEGSYQEMAKIPLVTSSNTIYDSVFTEEGFFLKSNKAGYFWNVENNTVYVYDFTQMENIMGRIQATEQGFICLIQQDGEVFLRTIYKR